MSFVGTLEVIIPKSCVPYIEVQRPNLHMRFERSLQLDFEQMEIFLPPSVKDILDIGCGVGGFSLMLWKYYKNPILHLLDGNGPPQPKDSYGFRDSMNPYNSMEVTREFLRANEVPQNSIMTYEAGKDPKIPNCGLVVSLMSWGFHFPVKTYLQLVLESMSPGSRLILDVRHGTSGRAELEKHLNFMWTIQRMLRSDRLCYELP